MYGRTHLRPLPERQIGGYRISRPVELASTDS
jgi:hypothetical protein